MSSKSVFRWPLADFPLSVRMAQDGISKPPSRCRTRRVETGFSLRHSGQGCVFICASASTIRDRAAADNRHQGPPDCRYLSVSRTCRNLNFESRFFERHPAVVEKGGFMMTAVG